MEAQAAHWCVRMQSPDCTEAERAACRRWRAGSPAHDAAFRRAANLWRQSVAMRDDIELGALMRQTELRRAALSRRRFWLWSPLAAGAAGLALLFALAPQWRVSLPEAPGVRYQTAVGEQKSIELPDGSRLVLDTDSTVVARYGAAQRQLELESGQASFEVAHDAALPFRVQVAGGTVTALGTRFIVRVEPAAAGGTVTLLEGKVVVESPLADAGPSSPATLAPGQQLRFDRAGLWTTAQVDPETASAWLEGILYARDWRLADLVEEMNRYSATQLRLVDPSLAELRVSGTFRTGDPQSLARLLEHSWPVRAEPGEAGEIQLSRRR